MKNAVIERGAKIEQRAQLELKLAQEQFYCDKIPQKRQLAVIGVALHILVIFLLWKLVVGIFKGTFGLIVGPLVFVIWVIWIVFSLKNEWGKDLKYLAKSNCNMEIAQSMARQSRLKEEIEQLEKEIEAIPVLQWHG